MPGGLSKLFGPRPRAERPRTTWGMRIAARLAQRDDPLGGLEAACRLLLRGPCTVALVCSHGTPELRPVILAGRARVCANERIAEILASLRGPLPVLAEAPLWLSLADDPFRPGATFLQPLDLRWAFLLPFAADLGFGHTRLAFVAAGQQTNLGPRDPLILELQTAWQVIRPLLGKPIVPAEAAAATWPANEAWETAPAALAHVVGDAVVAANGKARELVRANVGRDGHGWQAWLTGAVRKLEASQVDRQIVHASQTRDRAVEVTLGPPVPPRGGRLVGLHDASARAPQVEPAGADAHVLGHELRTPLATIRSTLDLVLGGDAGPVNANQERFLMMCRRNLDRLNRLVDDMLDCGRAEAGRLPLKPTDMDVATLLQEALTMVAVTCRQKEITLDVAGVPRSYRALVDGDKLQQMFHNVVSNALKYTPRGGALRIALVDLSEDLPGLAGTLARAVDLPVRAFALEVQDSGAGMSEDYLTHLFTPFSRDDKGRIAQVPGAGLGLYITRSLAEAHGGYVAVASRIGEGTAVQIVLPRDLEAAGVLTAARTLTRMHAVALATGLRAATVVLDVRDACADAASWQHQSVVAEATAFLARLAEEANAQRASSAPPLEGAFCWELCPGLVAGLALDPDRLSAAWLVTTCAPQSNPLLAGTQWKLIAMPTTPAPSPATAGGTLAVI